MIPEGPLHPDHAAAALVCAVAVAIALRRTRWLQVGLAVVALLVVHIRQPGAIASGLFDRPAGSTDLVLTAVAGGSIGWIGVRLLRTPFWIDAAVVASCIAVWGVAPDTEAALMCGLTAGVGALGRPTRAQHVVAVVAVMPMFAALVGTAGRPERLGLAVVVAVVGFALVTVMRLLLADRFGTGGQRVV